MKSATRDYRHGPSKRKPYQRRSQVDLKPAAESKIGLKRLISLMILLTLLLFLGYWIAQHFMTQGVKSDSEKPVDEILTSEVADTIQVPSSRTPQLAAQVAPLVVESLPVSSSVESSKSIQYTFYHGLAETEVVVDAEPIPVKLANPYYIVAGTFGSEAVAQKELNRLSSAQESVNLTVFKTDRYYRLRAGPFEDRLELNRKRNVLRSLGADTLLMRVKK